MKGIEQYFHMVLFIMLCKVFLTFKSVDENPSMWPFKSKVKCVKLLSLSDVQCGVSYYKPRRILRLNRM